MAQFTVALFTGFLLAFPVILYQVWKFVSCGLKDNEKKYIIIFAPFSLLLFFLGAAFAYFLVIPVCLKFLFGFSTAKIVPMITVNNYISFFGTMLLAFGVVFELPLAQLA